MLRTIWVLALCLFSLSLVQSAQVFDVLKYGAKADGKHKNTEAIAAAISAASAAGGGTVHFLKVAGDHAYLTGPIHFKSNVTLQLDDGVIIKFSDQFEDYLPMVNFRKGGTELKNFSPLIYGYKVSNVGIRGKGILDGSGQAWWDFFLPLRAEFRKTGHWNTSSKWHQAFLKANAEEVKHHPGLKQPAFYRPAFFQTLNSEHITLEGVTFINSPFFTVNPSLCDYLRIDHVTVRNPGNSPNTDGIHPASCRHVTISNCFVDTGDDGIVLTSDQDSTGLRHKRPAENITVTDSVVHQGHGGIVIGSVIKGDVRDVHARNLHFDGTQRGIRLKSGPGQDSVVERIFLSDITMHNISHEGITLNVNYNGNHFFVANEAEEYLDDESLEEPILSSDPSAAATKGIPLYRDIHIRNVTGDSKDGIQIVGPSEKHFERIELTDVHMIARHEMKVSHVNHLVKHNFTYAIDKHLYDKPKN